MTQQEHRVQHRSVALVTGAGSGIGRAVAVQLAGFGHAITLVGRTRAKLDETARIAGASDALIVAGDLADAGVARSCVDRCVERFGRLDLLVNVAGVARLAPIENHDESLLSETFAVNTFGPAHLIVRAWPVFQRQRTGCVVNVSTMGTIDPFPGFFAYAASKSALDSFTRSIAREGAGFGVTAYSVNPGAVETPLLRQLFDEAAIPRTRTLTPEVVAAVVVDCALGRRGGENGRTIAVPNP